MEPSLTTSAADALAAGQAVFSAAPGPRPVAIGSPSRPVRCVRRLLIWTLLTALALLPAACGPAAGPGPATRTPDTRDATSTTATGDGAVAVGIPASPPPTDTARPGRTSTTAPRIPSASVVADVSATTQPTATRPGLAPTPTLAAPPVPSATPDNRKISRE